MLSTLNARCVDSKERIRAAIHTPGNVNGNVATGLLRLMDDSAIQETLEGTPQKRGTSSDGCGRDWDTPEPKPASG